MLAEFKSPQYQRKATMSMDEYSKTAAKTQRAIQLDKAKEIERQMSRLLAIGDEQLLIDTLNKDYALTPAMPRFTTILEIWRSARRS